MGRRTEESGLRQVDVERVVRGAVSQARKEELAMCVAVVDEGGHLLSFTRMDGASRISVRMSMDKAFTAAMIEMPTGDLTSLVQPGASLYGLESAEQGRIVCFGGGIPLRSDGRVVGGVGVSGGSVEQDIAVAGAGRLALGSIDDHREPNGDDAA
jgi:uncharacterized protein GlcG (DUF336 family)